MTRLEELNKFIEDHAGAAELTTEELSELMTLVTYYLESKGKDAKVFVNGEVDSSRAFNALAITQEALTHEDSGAAEIVQGALEKAGAYYVRQYIEKFVSELPNTEEELTHIKANNITMPNTLLAQSLQEIMNKGDKELETSSRLRKGKSREPIIETANASFVQVGSNGAEIEGNYTLFHEAVFCAFISLWLSGNRAITASMIKKFLTQNFTGGIKKKSLEEIEQAIEDLQSMKVSVDITEEAKRRSWTSADIDRFKYGEKMLYLSEVSCISGGETVKAWTLYNPYRMPLLYEHASLSKQIITFPAKLLKIKDPNTGKIIRTTTIRTQIQFYLLRQIRNIRADHHRARVAVDKWNKEHKEEQRSIAYYKPMSPVISYETVFEKTGLSGKSNKTLIDCKEYIKACLKSWSDAGEIKGFEKLKTGKRKDVETGVKILLNEK